MLNILYINLDYDFFPIVFSQIGQCMVMVSDAFSLEETQGGLFGGQAGLRGGVPCGMWMSLFVSTAARGRPVSLFWSPFLDTSSPPPPP